MGEVEQPAGKGGGQVKPAAIAAPDVQVIRKIIYTATVDLLVEDLSEAQTELDKVIQANKAIIAHSDIRSVPGMPRSGVWKVRVPVDQFDDFLKELAKLGEVQKSLTDSKDVSEEYFDSQRRLANKKVQEERLRTHMKESTGKLPDILAVEKELGRVAEEIDQIQGRLKMWDNLTALSTVTINVNERKGYVPPESPSFGKSITRTFQGSVEALVTFGKSIVLFGVALAPWLPVLLVVLVPGWILLRRKTRKPNSG